MLKKFVLKNFVLKKFVLKNFRVKKIRVKKIRVKKFRVKKIRVKKFRVKKIRVKNMVPVFCRYLLPVIVFAQVDEVHDPHQVSFSVGSWFAAGTCIGGSSLAGGLVTGPPSPASSLPSIYLSARAWRVLIY